MSVHPPSDEQRAIIRLILSPEYPNVTIQAVAGSGKSTVILNTCQENTYRKCMMLTFNTALREEITQKAQSLGISNLVVHNYHSLAVKLYNSNAFDDIALHDIIEDALPPSIIMDIDVIFVDEAQDARQVYVDFVNKFVQDLKKEKVPQFVILGDPRQAVYASMGADSAFLINAEHHFKSDAQWKHMTMSTTFRLSNQICQFVNTHAFQEKVLVGAKSGKPVKYVLADTFQFKTGVYLAQIAAEYLPGDVMILFPSLKNNKLAHNISRKLTEIRMPVWVGLRSDDSNHMDNDIMRNKVIMTTFHQSKGSERPLVIVAGFDASYHEFYATDSDPTKSTDPMNVALTRASDQLVVVCDINKASFPTVDHGTLSFDANIVTLCKPRPRPKTSQRAKPKRARPVTDAMSFKLVEAKRACLQHVRTVSRPVFGETLLELKRPKIPMTFGGHEIHENVSNLYGIVIPAKAELIKTGSCYLADLDVGDRSVASNPKLVKILTKIKAGNARDSENSASNDELLYLAKHWESKNSFGHRMSQIGGEESWIENSHVDECAQRICDAIGSDVEFEFPVNVGDVLVGRIDCVDRTSDSTTLWEFKCGTVTKDHAIQLGLYATMYKRMYGPDSESNLKLKHKIHAKILDVSKNEIIEVHESDELLGAVTDSWTT